MENEELIAFNIISNSGEASTLFYKGIDLLDQGLFDEAEELFNQASSILVQAHKQQTALLVNESSGEKLKPSLLLIHAQDHLMNVMQLKELSKVIKKLYLKVDSFKLESEMK